MKGCIIERGNSYRIKVCLGKNKATGKYDSYYETFTGSKPDAQKRLRQLLTQYDKGVFIKPTKLTVREYLDKWLKDYAENKTAPSTYRVYEQQVRNHVIPQLGKINLTALSGDTIDAFYAKELKAGISPQSVLHYHTMMHKAFESAIKWGILKRNPADQATPPHVEKPEMKIYDTDEVNTYLHKTKESEPFYYPLFHLELHTGMRRSEILALRWKDIDLVFGRVSVNRGVTQVKGANKFIYRQAKTKKSKRSIPLVPSALEVMTAHYEKCKVLLKEDHKEISDDMLVFCHLDTGESLRPATVSRSWWRIGLKAKLKRIRLHDARHTVASILLREGVHPKIVQEILGHSNISITLDTYSHIMPGMAEAAMQKLDDAITPGYNKEAAKESKENQPHLANTLQK